MGRFRKTLGSMLLVIVMLLVCGAGCTPTNGKSDITSSQNGTASPGGTEKPGGAGELPDIDPDQPGPGSASGRR